MSLAVTEDTPPDMLAGSMDLNVVLPNGKNVKMSVQRGTPMMDLLVQATTTNCLSPGDYSLQAMGEKGVLPFKPNTPIGALDTFTVKIIEKKSQGRGRAPQVPQSFLNTFRLQVHLPRSQLFVLRVTPDITLYEIMTHICTEKNLNFDKYEFRNTANLDEIFELDKTLGFYKVQELSLIAKGNRAVTGLMSSADMINVKSSKHRQNSVCDSSLSSGSFGSRSGSPVPAMNVTTVPPQPPIRKKRRPAPKPPSFADKEPKKDRNFGPVLISHSRESSDSSGYHEASVLSESPTHGGPVVGLGGDSPPDTLPRRNKLPSSQSFTNLTSIQPAPKGRLIASVSNTSLNSNGCSRKKRAPPPPSASSIATTAAHMQKIKEDQIKSSTLPISIAEEMRNGYSFRRENNFTSAKVDDDDDEDYDVLADASDAKVQIPVEITSQVVNETKASKDDSPPAGDNVHGRIPPKPKPRTLLVHPPRSESKITTTTSTATIPEPSCTKDFSPQWVAKEEKKTKVVIVHRFVTRSSPHRRSCLDNLKEEEENGNGLVVKSGTKLCGGRSLGTFGESPSPIDNIDQTDHDSINWEYQLPPPPSDFRDSHSPNCTEFGTITITPEVLERVEPYNKPEPSIGDKTTAEPWNSNKSEQSPSYSLVSLKLDKLKDGATENTISCSDNSCNGYEVESHLGSKPDRKTSQNKTEVMSELTNMLNIENRKPKEKSLSVSNLYINEAGVEATEVGSQKSTLLNYSKSFSTKPAAYLTQYNGGEHSVTTVLGNNRKYSASGISDDEDSRSQEVTYRNFKNLEKSTSLECINAMRHVMRRKDAEDYREEMAKEEDEGIFRRPVAPVQKKLKTARRSASSIGANSRKKTPLESSRQDDSWADDPSIDVLRQQFLEFLKEKKLMNEKMKMKSLDVICNILPEVVNSNGHSHSHMTADHGNEISRISGSKNSTQMYSNNSSNTECKKGLKFANAKSEASLQNGSQENAQNEEVKRPREEKVKVVDVKVKSSVTVPPVDKFLSPLPVKPLDSMERPVVKAVEETSRPKPEANNRVVEEIARREKKPVQKQEVSKRYSYQGPPSFNFGTWGERPKTSTKIIIKDEDYVTRNKVTEKKSETVPQNGPSKLDGKVIEKKPEVRIENGTSHPGVIKPLSASEPKPPEVKKSQIVIKKPGALSHYEMFSALPKRKEISSLKFFIEEEEKRKAKESQESSRVVPVVCGIELKKEFKETEVPVVRSSPPGYTSHPPSKSHSVSVYVNGNLGPESREDSRKVNGSFDNFIIPKRNPSLMPVVKGFRSFEDHQPANNVGTAQVVPVAAGNCERKSPKCPSGPPLPPPPPPSVTSIKLKSNGFEPCRGKAVNVASEDPRNQLLDEIRNFGGLRKLRKSVAY